jgi:hypothetical protein
MAGLPPFNFLPPGHPAWHQAMMAQQQAQIAAQVSYTTELNVSLILSFRFLLFKPRLRIRITFMW